MDSSTNCDVFTQDTLDKLEARFRYVCGKFRKIDGNCWLFTGTNNGSYGSISLNYVYGRKTDRVHRFAWIAANKRMPTKKMHIAHTCGNGLCFNPEHLVEKTATENQRDKREHGTNKGRQGKLTAEQKEQVFGWVDAKKFESRKVLVEHISNTFGVKFSIGNLNDLLYVRKNGPRKRVKKSLKDVTEVDIYRAFSNAMQKATFEKTERGNTTFNCLVTKYAQKGKYVVVTLPGQTTAYLHQVAAAAWHNDGKLFPAYKDDGNRLEIDHLCGNTRCIMPTHLEAVSCRTNQLRKSQFDTTETKLDLKLSCPISECAFDTTEPGMLARHIKSEHVTGKKRKRS